MYRARSVAAIIFVLVLALSATVASANKDDGRPVLTPQPVNANPGESFNLEVSVQAWADANYTVTFKERSRFSFTGQRSVTHTMSAGDGILFKVPCVVDDDAPDGDFPVEYNVTWSVNGTKHTMDGQVTVTVGEGAGGDTCTTSKLLLVPSALASTILMVRSGRRGGGGRRAR